MMKICYCMNNMFDSVSKVIRCIVFRPLLAHRRHVESIRITTEALSNGPQGGIHLLVPLLGAGHPQDLHGIVHAGNQGYTIMIHLKSSASQECIFKIDKNIFLIMVISLGGLYLGHLEVLIDIVTLLTNGLDNGILNELLVQAHNILKQR
jgi:hypothetical protein